MTGKKLLLVLFTVGMVVVSTPLLIMTGCGKSAPTETIELTFPTGSHNLAQPMWDASVGQWIREIEEASGGRVKINELVGAAPDQELFDMVARGAGDISFLTIMFNTGRFPCLEMMTIPDIGTVCRRPSRVAWDYWKASPEIDNEFSGVKILAVFATTYSPPGTSFATADKPVHSLEDFQGLKIGVFGEWVTKLVAGMGAVPVSVPPPGVYEAIQRKIIDGSCMSAEMLEGFMIYEVVNYWHNLGYQFAPFWLVMNADKWNSLPPDIQDIIDEASAHLPDAVDTVAKETALRAIETGKTRYGMEVIDFTPEEITRWRERQDLIQAEYIARLEKKGIDGTKLFDELNRLYAKHAEW